MQRELPYVIRCDIRGPSWTAAEGMQSPATQGHVAEPQRGRTLEVTHRPDYSNLSELPEAIGVMPS